MEELKNELVPLIDVVGGMIQDNLDTLEFKVMAIAESFKGIVLTDITRGKKIRADLRTLQTVLNDEKIKAKKKVLMPYEALEAKVKSFLAILEKPIQEIDRQIKEEEAKVKDDRKKLIKAMLESEASALSESGKDFLFSAPWHMSEKWVAESYWTATGNATKALKEELAKVVQNCGNSVATIQNVAGEYVDQVLEDFRINGDLGAALEKLNGLKVAKARSEKMRLEREQREVPVQPSAPAIPAIPLGSVVRPVAPIVIPSGAHTIAVPPKDDNPVRTFTLVFRMTEQAFQGVRSVLDLTGILYEELPF